MRILVSFKTTNLSVLGEDICRKVSQGRLDKSYLDRLEQDDEAHHRCRRKLLLELDRHNITWVEVSRGLYWPDLSDIDAVISVGGDGTVLEASHHIHSNEIPLIGIRSSPMSVGQLCSGHEETIPTLINKFASGNLNFINLRRLRCKIFSAFSGNEIKTVPIVNDFLFANAFPAATTRYNIKWDGKDEVHKSSGIWLATAAGSSAVIEAAGGRRIPMQERNLCFQFVVRELYKWPIKTPPIIQKGFFHPESNPLFIENRSEKAILALDGQHGLHHLSLGDRLYFELADDLKLAYNV